MHLATFLLLSGAATVLGKDNGKSVRPPMGWRSWNLFGADVSQELIQSQMDGIVSRDRLVDGVPTSLADLGYIDVGLDDAWQLCGSYGPEGYTYHAEDGSPVIDTSLFPDFKAMTDYAHKLNITAGWYGNNCICRDKCHSDECYEEDVKALVALGFDSIKLDNCGAQRDLQKWSDLMDANGGSHILIENCHWGRTFPTTTWCPWNYYRTSGDVRASYESVVGNLMSTVKFAQAGLSYPGCWAYPDMLEVGCEDGPGGEKDAGLTYTEAQTHFGAWCIVSSPLILSHDLNNATVVDGIWDIITNKEAIAINQAWAGESGTLFKESNKKIRFWNEAKPQMVQGKEFVKTSLTGETSVGAPHVAVGAWQQWSKKLSDSKTAVLVMNNDDKEQSVTLTFADVPSFASNDASTAYSIRDVWTHSDKEGTFTDSTEVTLEAHASAFYVIESMQK